MSGWMIGLGIVGTVGGFLTACFGEMARDWNGGQTQPGALKRTLKTTFIGAALGVGAGWLLTDSPQQKALDECYEQAPVGATVSVTSGPNGVDCKYLKP